MAMAAPIPTIIIRALTVMHHHSVSILQSWFSPSFPIGGFSYSSGLETAIRLKHVHDKETLQDWIGFILKHGAGRNDALFVSAAFMGEECNDLCLALAPGRERYLETIELGAAFTRTVNSSYELNLPRGLAYPVAVGMAAARLDLDLRLTVQSFVQAFVTNLISVGVRSIPIGQTAGQSCLYELMPSIEGLAEEAFQSDLEDFGTASLGADLVSMRHESDEIRIYRT